MKNQALFSSKDKSKKIKCCLLQFLFGALRVNNAKLHPKHTSRLANSVDTDQSASFRSHLIFICIVCLVPVFRFCTAH